MERGKKGRECMNGISFAEREETGSDDTQKKTERGEKGRERLGS
jgi:hypothetical protein